MASVEGQIDSSVPPFSKSINCCNPNLSKPINEWSASQVLEWMGAMELDNSIDCFKNRRISGADLVEISDKKLQDMGVSDEYQRRIILMSIDQLCGRQNIESDSEGSSTESYDEFTSDASEHNFTPQNFTSQQKCHQCNKPLKGSLKPTLQCTACGLTVHSDCVDGKVRSCNHEKLEMRKSKMHAHSIPELATDITNSRHGIPDILYACTKELEKRVKNPDINLIECYQAQPNSDEVNAVKGSLLKSDDMFSVDLELVKSETLCGVIKKYLRILSKPLIPTELYEDFISAAEVSDEAESIETLSGLVNKLSESHHTTLQYLMSHFSRICDVKDKKNQQLMLSRIFCQIILRPDWPQLMNLVHNARYHIVLLQRLFILCDNNNDCSAAETSLSSAASAACFTQTTSSSLSKTDEKPGLSLYEMVGNYSYANDITLSLEQCSWYWADVSRDEVHDVMDSVTDGTFLVRNATSFKTHGDYTLVLRLSGANLLIKIYHRKAHYGFCEDRCDFASVPELVRHYQHNSLAEYNAKLNTRLVKGLARPGQMESLKSSDPQYLLKQLRKNHVELMALTRSCDGLVEKQKKLSHDIQLLNQAQESFKELSKIFEEQIQHFKQDAPKSSESANHLTDVEKSEQLLRNRLQSVNVNRDRLSHTIQERTGECGILTTDISAIKPALKKLAKKQDSIICALLGHGISLCELEHILTDDSLHPSETSTVGAHGIQSNWFVNCSRTQAIELLKSRADGTFLIRPGSQDNPYSLSIVLNGVVGHCKILQNDGLYGFAEPFLLYRNLTELVLHYKDHSLSSHNPQLHTSLIHPVNA